MAEIPSAEKPGLRVLAAFDRCKPDAEGAFAAEAIKAQMVKMCDDDWAKGLKWLKETGRVTGESSGPYKLTDAGRTMASQLRSRRVQRGPSRKLFAFGFTAAILLAFVCLSLSAIYLFEFSQQNKSAVASLLFPAQRKDPSGLAPANAAQPKVEETTPQKIDENTRRIAIAAENGDVKIALLSCGMFIGMSFGFLGFGLFLLGIHGEIDAAFASGNYSLKVGRMAPGVFVILCATVLVVQCATHDVTFGFSLAGANNASDDSADSNPATRPMKPGDQSDILDNSNPAKSVRKPGGK